MKFVIINNLQLLPPQNDDDDDLFVVAEGFNGGEWNGMLGLPSAVTTLSESSTLFLSYRFKSRKEN